MPFNPEPVVALDDLFVRIRQATRQESVRFEAEPRRPGLFPARWFGVGVAGIALIAFAAAVMLRRARIRNAGTTR